MVQEGGHHIVGDVIKKRFQRGLANFEHSYQRVVDAYYTFDNCEGKSKKQVQRLYTFIPKKLFARRRTITNEVSLRRSQASGGLTT